jgi:hypothetical protein
VGVPPKKGVMLRFSYFNCAYLMDYHWDHLRHLTHLPYHTQTVTVCLRGSLTCSYDYTGQEYD